MVTASACLACAGLVDRVAAQTSTNIPAWRLVWSDEFDQPNGTRPNPLRWGYDIGGDGWGNQELESYTSRTNNVRIENGMLVIEARKENYTGSDGVARQYTSARIKTEGKYATTYGRIEARIQIPHGQGMWPAFWTLGTNIGSVGWPTCGEVDIMENIGSGPTWVKGTVHGPGYSGGNGIGHTYYLPSGRPFADDFHVYAVEWSPEAVRFLVDSHAYFTVTPASLPSGAKWVYTGPEFILLNVAVGGLWPGSPDATTVFPQRMLVDYVRVYTAEVTAPPRLRAETITNHVFVEWPGLFPQALLETAKTLRGPWALQTTSGQLAEANFFAEIQPGFYRLQLGD